MGRLDLIIIIQIFKNCIQEVHHMMDQQQVKDMAIPWQWRSYTPYFLQQDWYLLWSASSSIYCLEMQSNFMLAQNDTATFNLQL